MLIDVISQRESPILLELVKTYSVGGGSNSFDIPDQCQLLGMASTIFELLGNEDELRKTKERILNLFKRCLDDSISVLDAVLDAYDEEVERETYLNLLKEKIEDLWEQRSKYNKHFLDVVVQLKVVSRILDYEILSKSQIESIKEVFSLLKKIEITKEDTLLCWKTLESSGIDLNAPIKGYENFELVLREKPHRK